ncbi:hypothetical protein [Actinomadura rupiterrae]|uniref:hypothetical protein n=1 Tax=Actinomadura rupiterrae TaxID=559627 RepID=UPI0020A41248|nr:hypothetical protein [Actinomadura rupiterrae]MCP2334802.1 hypothetical protein [Actinomadura rupiterrae]
MLQTVAGGRYWCALVVKASSEVDDALLAAIADATDLTFEYYGNGGFGGETLADVYKADENLLMEVECDEVGVKALLIRADTTENAVAIRAVIGDSMSAWSEQMLRAQLEDTFAESPQALVALLMATGGAQPDEATLALLQRAAEHDRAEVRHYAEYAAQVAAELVHPPVVMHETEAERELDWALRPSSPVPGDERWVTVRAGVPERAVPRPVTWLKTPLEDDEPAGFWAYTANWNLAVLHDRENAAWREIIYTPRDGRTALHVVQHEALGPSVHLAVHGDLAEETAAKLAEDLNAEILSSAPDGLPRTASAEPGA